MLFHWLRDQRRKRLLEAPFPRAWLLILERNVPQYAHLRDAEQGALRDHLRVLIAEKFWEGCGGLLLTDEIQVTVAALAGLLTLYLEDPFYPRLRSILIYPSAYRARTRTRGPAGVVTVGRSDRLGEASGQGVVILSWQDVLAGAQREHDGHNLVFHEFAHQLDMTDGSPDGTPVLPDDPAYRRWYEVMKIEYERLVHTAHHGGASVLDTYGAEDAAELFAVATEAFFERGIELRGRHPELYRVLSEFYRQDPAHWDPPYLRRHRSC
jgi:Mlc titration factor MtfA (ptsG expression regulator)